MEEQGRKLEEKVKQSKKKKQGKKAKTAGTAARAAGSWPEPLAAGQPERTKCFAALAAASGSRAAGSGSSRFRGLFWLFFSSLLCLGSCFVFIYYFYYCFMLF